MDLFLGISLEICLLSSISLDIPHFIHHRAFLLFYLASMPDGNSAGASDADRKPPNTLEINVSDLKSNHLCRATYLDGTAPSPHPPGPLSQTTSCKDVALTLYLLFRSWITRASTL